MIDLDKHLYNSIQSLNKEIKIKLKKKGLVLPSKNNDGSIRIGNYSILKKKRSYFIKDDKGNIVVKNINLPHSAITIANNLALTHFVDKFKLELDHKYGAAYLDNEIHQQMATNYIKKKQYDRAEIMLAKSSLAHHKAETLKKVIVGDFEKLLRIDK